MWALPDLSVCVFSSVCSYVIFRLYFGKIHSFASDFISEESFRPEEFFEDDFQAIRVSRAVGGPRVF